MPVFSPGQLVRYVNRMYATDSVLVLGQIYTVHEYQNSRSLYLEEHRGTSLDPARFELVDDGPVGLAALLAMDEDTPLEVTMPTPTQVPAPICAGDIVRVDPNNEDNRLSWSPGNSLYQDEYVITFIARISLGDRHNVPYAYVETTDGVPAGAWEVSRLIHAHPVDPSAPPPTNRLAKYWKKDKTRSGFSKFMEKVDGRKPRNAAA